MSTTVHKNGQLSTKMDKRILELIMKEPEKKLHIREIARLCKLSPTTSLKAVSLLKEKGIIKVEKSANLTLVSADLDSPQYKIKKMLFNLESLYDSGIIGFLDSYYHDPRAIVLFGSYRRGEDLSRSDIDIAVITSQTKRPGIEKFENKLHRSIQILPVQLKSISEEFFNNLINGFVLKGHLAK